MSTSLLYHAFGVRGYRYVATDYLEGEVMFRVEAERETCRCAACDSANVIRRLGEKDCHARIGKMTRKHTFSATVARRF